MKYISFGIRLYLPKTEVFDVAGKVKTAAELFQLFLSKMRDLLQIDLFIDRTAIMEGTLGLLNPMETVKLRKDVCLWSDHFFKMSQFKFEQLVENENKLFGYCQPKYISSLFDKSKKVVFLIEYLPKLLLLSLVQQLIVQSQQLQLVASPHLEWKIFVQILIFKAQSFIEGLNDTILQVFIDGVFEDLHVFPVKGLLETAVCQALMNLFKIKDSGLWIILRFAVDGSMLVVKLRGLHGHLIYLVFQLRFFS